MALAIGQDSFPSGPAVGDKLGDFKSHAHSGPDAGKADIAKHFGLKGTDRRALRMMLRELEDEGKLGRRGKRGFAEAGSLPPVGVADVVERDIDGELYVRLVKGADDVPLARLVPDKKGLLGIQLPNESSTGPNSWLRDNGIPVYNWNHERFADWVEEAATKAGR